MSLTIELPAELEEQLRAVSAREGQTPDAYALAVLQENLTESRARRLEKNRAAIALLRSWRSQPPDPEGEEGYPETITRSSNALPAPAGFGVTAR